MEIWLDTCDVDYLRKIVPSGLIEGVTTNPSIVRGHDLQVLIPEILQAQKGKLCIQVNTTDFLAQATALSSISERILVKIPTHSEGLKCMQQLAESNIPFLATGIFTAAQALLAFKAGASYLAPYLGRILDEGDDPWSVLRSIQEIKRAYDYHGKVLAASLRSTNDVKKCAEMGLDAVTLRPSLFDEWLTPPTGLTKALQEWESSECAVLCNQYSHFLIRH